MVRKSSLSEFQAHLAARLARVDTQRTASFLGVMSGDEHWLVELPDSGEVVSLPPLSSVPMTRPWFAGVANIRGNLYAVSDFSAFCGKEATLRNTHARLLLIGTRYGNNAALLMTRILGLRHIDDMIPAVPDTTLPWASKAYRDKEGCHWQMLNVKRLFSDDAFMNIGI